MTRANPLARDISFVRRQGGSLLNPSRVATRLQNRRSRRDIPWQVNSSAHSSNVSTGHHNRLPPSYYEAFARPSSSSHQSVPLERGSNLFQSYHQTSSRSSEQSLTRRIQEQRDALLRDLLSTIIATGPDQHIDPEFLSAVLPEVSNSNSLNNISDLMQAFFVPPTRLPGGGHMSSGHSSGTTGNSRLSSYQMEQLLLNPPENLSYETLWEISEYLGYVKNRAADSKSIQKLVSFTFGSSAATTTLKQEEASLRCCICLTDFEGGESLKEMPCKHYFHSDCLENWLYQNGSCPICRKSLLQS